MKKTKTILALALALLLALTFAACGGGTASSAAPPASTAPDAGAASEATPTEGGSSDGTFELALITDLGTIDDKSFNQGAWEGLVQYAEENDISHKYYQPTEQSDDAYLAAIDLAVKGGAKLVVTPGFLFEVPIFLAQDTYPDVHFVLVDGEPHDADYAEFKTGDNAVGILYEEQQAGFLAGYAAVKDGMTQLGFMGGMAVPAVVRFGYGYVQGAEYAAEELGLAAGSVQINYHYTGAFEASPEAQTMAASWYNDGIEVIFGCGGAVGNSVMAAAEQAGAKVIGVDVDQSSESDTVITSATKGLRSSVYSAISDFYAGSFPGGTTLRLGADNDGVGLPMDTSKFETFSQSDYDAIYAQLADGSIAPMKDTDDAGNEIKVSELPVSIATVTEF